MPTPASPGARRGRTHRRKPAPAGLAGARRARPPPPGSRPRATRSRRPRSGRARGRERAPHRGPGPSRRDRALRHDLGDVRQVGCGPALARALLDLVDEEGERLVEELDRLEQRVGEPASNACRASSIRFCRSGFSTMNVTACSAPTSCGIAACRPSPGSGRGRPRDRRSGGPRRRSCGSRSGARSRRRRRAPRR